MLLTLVAAAVLLGVVIFVHELGHFLAAKAVGIGVPTFSIGFGAPTPLRWKHGETEYVVAWLPLGGYVKMATKEEDPTGPTGGSAIERGSSEGFPPERLFENKPLWARIIVISAGVTMNVVLAWLIFGGLALRLGQWHDATTRVASVTDSLLPPAASALADLPFGTRVLRINGDTIATWDALQSAIRDTTTSSLRFDVSGRPEPVVIPVSGHDTAARSAIADALQPLHEPEIADLIPGYPASEAGLKPGDRVVRANGDTIRTWEDLVAATAPSGGDTLRLTILRADSTFRIAVVPTPSPTQDPVTGAVRTVGLIGATDSVPFIRTPLTVGGAAVAATHATVGAVGQVWFAVKGLVLRQVSPRELGGPIRIGQLSGQAAREGAAAFLGFMAFISVNLAVLNILPIPVLDGGHLLFLLLEGIRRRPVSVAVRARVTQVGLALLLALMLFVIVNDVARIVH